MLISVSSWCSYDVCLIAWIGSQSKSLRTCKCPVCFPLALDFGLVCVRITVSCSNFHSRKEKGTLCLQRHAATVALCLATALGANDQRTTVNSVFRESGVSSVFIQLWTVCVASELWRNLSSSWARWRCTTEAPWLAQLAVSWRYWAIWRLLFGLRKLEINLSHSCWSKQLIQE